MLQKKKKRPPLPAVEKLGEVKEALGPHTKARSLLLWSFQITVVLVFAVLVAIGFFQTVTMREASMEPTIDSGDKMFVNRLAYKMASPKRGDIIVFKTSASENAALHIKRVVGLPGEFIQIQDGRVLIDGETYKEGKDFPVISNPGTAENGVSLDAGEYFVLGDNRNNSEDSRYGDIGKVQKKYIVGEVWFVSSPLSKLGFLRG